MTEIFTFPETWQWLDRPPLHLETGLQDHVVVVLYWRLGCVHSRAALSELAMLQTEFSGQPVAVVAVHVPTCDEERDEARIRRFVQSLPCAVTVAMASDAAARQRLPSLLLIDAGAVVRTRASGVPRRAALRAAFEALLTEARGAGRTVDAPFVPTHQVADGNWLPSSIVSDEEHVWIASAARRQVLQFDGNGAFVRAIGSGAPGDEDGEPDQASFWLPGSLAVHDEYLVVADAFAHTLRAIDRQSGEVRTWCGTGHLGHDAMGGSYGRDQELSSPHGVVSRDGGLYVCIAGTDQLWQVDPMTGSAMAWLGGDAADYGGDSYADAAATFSEPLALCDDEQSLWVVEGRGHTLSEVDLAHVQRRIVSDGFRRPVDVVTHGGRVFVADAFEAKVFAVAADGDFVATLIGPEHGLVEPVSLTVHGALLLVADAGAGQVFAWDLDADKPELKPWQVRGLPDAGRSNYGPFAVLTEPVHVSEYSDVTLRIATPGHADGVPVTIDVLDEAMPILAVPRREVTEVRGGYVQALLPVEAGGDGALRLRMVIDGIETGYVVPVVASADGESQATLVLPV